jgi:hypothetical protein
MVRVPIAPKAIVTSDPTMLTDASTAAEMVIAIHIDVIAASFADRDKPPESRKRCRRGPNHRFVSKNL